MDKIFELELLSGGRIRIDYSKCGRCLSKACVKFCQSSTLDPVLKIREGIPVLSDDAKKDKRGWCTECLACELNCNLYGQSAIKIELPLTD